MLKSKKIAFVLLAVMVFSTGQVSVFAEKSIGTGQILATTTEGDLLGEIERLGLEVPEGITPTEVGILKNTGLIYGIGSIDYPSSQERGARRVFRADSWSGNVTIYPYAEGATGIQVRSFTTYPGTTARLSWLGFTTATSINIGIKDEVSGWDDYIRGMGANTYMGLSGADPSHNYTWRASLNGTTQADDIRFTNVAPY